MILNAIEMISSSEQSQTGWCAGEILAGKSYVSLC